MLFLVFDIKLLKKSALDNWVNCVHTAALSLLLSPFLSLPFLILLLYIFKNVEHGEVVVSAWDLGGGGGG